MTSIPSSNEKTKLILVGASGKLGRSIAKYNKVTYGICSLKNPFLGKKIEGVQEPLISSLSEVNLKIGDSYLVIDASNADNFKNVYEFCLKNKIPLVLASTGHNQKNLNKLNELSINVPVLKAPNLSEGIAFFKTHILKPIIENINSKTNLQQKSINSLDAKDVKIKIIETHHEKKIDAPSGTALDLKDYIKAGLKNLEPKIKIDSIRDRESVGRHQIIFKVKNEEFIVTHNALTRDIFGEGIKLASHLINKKPGIYSMINLIEDF